MVSPKSALKLNAFILISISLTTWKFFSDSNTALIPAFFGFIMLILFFQYDKNNKLIAHLAILLIVLALGGLSVAMSGRLNDKDLYGLSRVSVMMLTTIYALLCFIKSFIDARKN